MQTVEIDRPSPEIAVVRLNRPAAMNALSMRMRQEFVHCMADAEADPDCRIVILTGAGKAFCAGLDLAELGESAEALLSIGAGDPVAAVERFSGPVIAAINGAAVTGGFELALACDVLIASERARFADTHAQVGVMPGWGLSQRLSRAIGVYRAKEMSLTGRFVDALEAERWGLVNRVVAPDELLPSALELARMMLASAPGMLARYKNLITQGFADTLASALAEEKRRADDFNHGVESDTIAGRRDAVQARGRGG
ncbi:Enoyl-CoA hydratase/isomerase [Sphingobium chlorophenolicum L-1]|uniref:Enoyl-CoA hydratase/isomerase n=1 Tax=Sphingobium chlorophenolicum L-1 TaxID=690566 RepID=F6F213_SPHCR|nr:enoyl-CoA hydratase [Sphingobium chlorophenolicum]AEG51579.1 Enoyl-CoA hydratase/isomerase [Sphingobium chlorophenolicum L-1]